MCALVKIKEKNRKNSYNKIIFYDNSTKKNRLFMTNFSPGYKLFIQKDDEEYLSVTVQP